MMQLEAYDLIVITVMWDDIHDWSMMIEGSKVFRRDRQGKRSGGVALYVKSWTECEELHLRNSHAQVESS